MLKKTFLPILFILLTVINLSAQTNDKQWEYFLADISTLNFSELGSKGWELVGVVPPGISDGYSTGGTQYIFKRPLDSIFSQQDAVLRKANQNKQQPPDFINLDAAEQQSTQNQREEKAKVRIAQEIKNIKGFTVLSFKPTVWFPNANDRRIGGELVIDASKELLVDGNKYRASEADKLIRRAADEVYRAVGLQPQFAGQAPFNAHYQPNAGGVNIKISLVAVYNGITKTLAEGSVVGAYPETIK